MRKIPTVGFLMKALRHSGCISKEMQTELWQQVLSVHWKCRSYTRMDLNVSSVFQSEILQWILNGSQNSPQDGQSIGACHGMVSLLIKGAQVGYVWRSNMGTIQVNVPSITTATPTMLTPSPALTLNRKEHKCQSPKKKT